MTSTYEREAQALERKHFRLNSLAEASAWTGPRKRGEVAKLCKIAETIHDLLLGYDVDHEPPPIADLLATTFDAVVVRIADCEPKAPPANPAVSAEPSTDND